MLEKILGGASAPGQASRRAAAAFNLPNRDVDPSVRGVMDSDAILWFGPTTTAEAHAAAAACLEFRTPFMPVYPDASFEPAHIARWLHETQIRILHVDGCHEDQDPGIGERVEWFLIEVFRLLGHKGG